MMFSYCNIYPFFQLLVYSAHELFKSLNVPVLILKVHFLYQKSHILLQVNEEIFIFIHILLTHFS